jgi:hypothetical protein
MTNMGKFRNRSWNIHKAEKAIRDDASVPDDPLSLSQTRWDALASERGCADMSVIK